MIRYVAIPACPIASWNQAFLSGLRPVSQQSRRRDMSPLSSLSTTATMTNTKPYDVVLFGATSFVGKLVFEYYLRNYPASTEFKWAVAARSEAKLSALKESLASEVDEAAASLPVIIADSMDQQSLDNMAAQAKVILTTVGPYNRYGSKLVEACARAGVHLCDLTGESTWVRDMIDKHHALAESTGAKIVPSCGFDSIPADMGAFFMVDHMKRKYGVSPDDVRYFLRDSKGALSGGTIASAIDIMDEIWSGGSKVMKKMNDPLLLTYSPSEGGGGSGSAGSSRFKNARDPGGLGYDSMVKSWTAPSIFASHDSKVVYRSGSILGYPDTFRYKEVMTFKGLVKGVIPAIFTTFVTTLGGILLIFPPTRKLIARFLPAPGEGPSKELMNSAYFWVDFIAKARVEGKDVICRAKIGSDKGDPGYKETAKMLAECGLCLALEEDQIESKKGGVLTTATAMGMPLIDRLRSAGMTFEMIQG